MLLVPAASFLALLFAGYLAAKVKSHDEGTPDMVAIAEAIREGARAYLKRQYTGVAIFFAVVLAIMVVLVVLEYIVVFVPLAFVTGGAFSALAGYIGMSIATASGARTANAAKSSLDAALQLAFSSGAVMGLAVVGLGLLDLSVWFYFLNWFYRDADLSTRITGIASTMLNFGLGASSVALFARVGGGIFTKAADVGADLVGKLEAGIPEDDPRNPAVIADNVGDNVGDRGRHGRRLVRIICEFHCGHVGFGTCRWAVDGGDNGPDDSGGHRCVGIRNRYFLCPFSQRSWSGRAQQGFAQGRVDQFFVGRFDHLSFADASHA